MQNYETYFLQRIKKGHQKNSNLANQCEENVSSNDVIRLIQDIQGTSPL